MNLYEYEAKRIFQEFGIAVPPSATISRPEELRDLKFDYPLALKCQVLTNDRGKAGGIRFAADLKEAEQLASEMLALTIGGSKTQCLLVEPKLSIARELYIAVMMDRDRRCPIFVASTEGGENVESSEHVVTINISYPYRPFNGRKLARMLGFKGEEMAMVADLANRLFKVFEERDLDLAEIDALGITSDKRIIALDGKLSVNDDALGLQPYFEGWLDSHLSDLSEREQRARALGLNLVELDGNIGIVCNGAGLAMATMDMIKNHGGNPANFLDAGAGFNKKALSALEIVSEMPAVDVMILNVLVGMTACDDIARGLLSFREKHPERTMVVRLRGSEQERAEQMLEGTGITLFRDFDAAVKEVVAKSKSVKTSR